MKKEEFIRKTKQLAEDVSEKNVKIWTEWAEECVEAKQYLNLVEKPKHEAVGEWLEAMYKTLYFVRQEFGQEIAKKVIDLSESKLCLYPYEMERAAKALQEGGSIELIYQLMNDGLLESDRKDAPWKTSSKER